MFWYRSAERKGLEPLRQKYDYSEISNLLPYQLGLPLHLKKQVNLRATDWRNGGFTPIALPHMILPPVALHLTAPHDN